MPIIKQNGKYKFGENGKEYKSKKKAVEQAVAIAYSESGGKKKGAENYLKKELGSDSMGTTNIQQHMEDEKELNNKAFEKMIKKNTKGEKLRTIYNKEHPDDKLKEGENIPKSYIEKEKHSPNLAIRKKANFASNASKWEK